MTKAQRQAKMSENIRAAVRTCGLSQNAVAKRLDIDPAMISRFMNARGGLSQAVLDRLCELLDLHIVKGGRK
jgi:transcriptional regulator with XRE-family HTH domain